MCCSMWVCVFPDMSVSRVLTKHQGRRMALPHSRVMIHQPMGGAQGQAEDIKVYKADDTYVYVALPRWEHPAPSRSDCHDVFSCAFI